MKLLAIETSSEACSVALDTGHGVIERYALTPRGHADRLLPWVEEVMKEGGLALKELDAIAFSRGPGSFTSLRIGISVVQGLAWGAGLDVVPVSSLAATAQVAAQSGVRHAVVAMDARMREVFTASFSLDEAGIMVLQGDETVCPPSSIQWPQGDGWHAVGNGFERYPELVSLASKAVATHVELWPRATAVLRLAEHSLKRTGGLPASAAQPVYLRDNVAQKTRDRQA
jgi:tRNA threonylcarbamoyladenosine biosynthesis protein TsaB